MKIAQPLLKWLLSMLMTGMVLGVLGSFALYFYYASDLPDIDTLKEVQYQVPLTVYDRNRVQFAEYGKKRRIPLGIHEIPETQQQAFVAIEDARYYDHIGVDPIGIVRAGIKYLSTGEKKEGASTITMQVARNFFLTRAKTFDRKLREIFIALKIEQELSKDEILSLYLNKIYLGKRSYGVGAAASVYYGTTVDKLTLAQQAMIAGLPKAPSTFNPIVNPERAKLRRDYVLTRMHDAGFITEEQMLNAQLEPLSAMVHQERFKGIAPYVGEMVRSQMVEQFGEDAYTSGLRVYTTIDLNLQRAAEDSLREGLLAYDRRHGWRGAEGKLNLDEEMLADPQAISTALDGYAVFGGLEPAVVLSVDKERAQLMTKSGESVELGLPGHEWVGKFVNESVKGPEPKALTDFLSAGDVVRVRQELVAIGEDKDTEPKMLWQLAQVPAVSGALISMQPRNGAILAVTGGFDFYHSKFNRAMQAERQPGSVFKPFIYTTALENGYTPASIINDAPVVFDDPALESTWRPENYGGRVYGPTRLRQALKKSRNLVSIRLMRALGVRTVLNSVQRFGFDVQRLPADLSLSLGSGTAKPVEIMRAYGVFANGGFLVQPYFIERVENQDNDVLWQSFPQVACDEPCEMPQVLAPEPVAEPLTQVDRQDPEQGAESPVVEDVAVFEDKLVQKPVPIDQVPLAERVLTPQITFQMVSLMRDVVRGGTGVRAMQLGRNDLAGKTGTTNDQQDAWFSGYNGDVVTTAWVGFDQVRPMGGGETGAGAALPIWIDFMREALQGRPETQLVMPSGITTVRIDPQTGLLASPGQADAIFETFREEFVPTESAILTDDSVMQDGSGDASSKGNDADVVEQLF